MPQETISVRPPAPKPALRVKERPARGDDPPDAGKVQRLIEAAEDIFVAKGYHTATMNDVANAAGMSKKTIYRLIDSKACLFVALLEYRQEKLVIPLRQADWSLRETLIRHLLCLAQFLLSTQQIAIIRLIMAEYTHGRDFGRLFHQKRVGKAKMSLESCLSDICRRDDNTKELSSMLFGLALGEFHLGMLLGFRQMPAKPVLTRRIELAVDLFLAGYEAMRRE